MTSTLTVYIGPEATPLILSGDCTSPTGITCAALGLPDWGLRYAYAPPSVYVAGNVLLAAVRDAGEVLLTVTVEASSLTEMEYMKTQVENAVAAWPGQFRAEVTNDVETVVIAGPWETFPTVLGWGDVLMPLLDYYTVDTTFSLPVNPPGSP